MATTFYIKEQNIGFFKELMKHMGIESHSWTMMRATSGVAITLKGYSLRIHFILNEVAYQLQ